MSDPELLPPLFLDANVLFGSLKRDLLITCAEALEVKIAWSAEVLDEVGRNLRVYFEERGVVDGEQRIANLFAALNKTYQQPPSTPESTYDIGEGWPDANDRHIVLGAIRTGSSIIVTENSSDFPTALLGKVGLSILTTDQVLTALMGKAQEDLVFAIEDWLTKRHRPAYTRAELAARLREVGLPDFADELERAWAR